MFVHPALPFLLTALMTLVKGRSPLQRALHLAVPALAFACLYPYLPKEGLRELHRLSIPLGSYSLQILKVDSLSILFACTFMVYTLLANLFAYQVKNRVQLIGAYLYAGSSIGAVLSGDLAVLFIFWELMALASALLVWNPDKPASLKAVFRYLLVHAAGGLLFFSGLLLRISEGQSLAFAAQPFDTAGWLFFAAFAVNAALPPAHAWLPDAYSSSTPEGGVYLSAFTSKVAVFAFARCFAGSDWLIGLGAAAALLGVLYALMEDDIRKLLSYHLICQVGFMLAGIGLGSDLGINGAAGHAVGNILFKGLLFMTAGVIIMKTGTSRLSELGGLAAKDRSLVVFFMVGALAISGMPGLNGYVTKSLLLAAASKAHLAWLEILFLAVSVGTFLSIGLKLTNFAFYGKSKTGSYSPKLPIPVLMAMSGAVFLCFLIGLDPGAFLYPYLPYTVVYDVFTPSHIFETLQLLAGTLAAFLIMRSHLHPHAAVTLDIDWFYRKGGDLFVKGVSVPARLTHETIQAGLSELLKSLNEKLKRAFPSVSIPAAGQTLLIMLAGFTAAALWFSGIRF